ncbi:MAG: YlxR family protein [Actinomycetales bacterium]
MVDATDRHGRRPGSVPQRTCIGCRVTAPRSVLMRIVAVRAGDGFVAELDERRRRPGRGAWLHPSPDCFDLAVRRRAFTRALRVAGPLDTTGLAAALSEAVTRQGQHDQHDSTTHQAAVPVPGDRTQRRTEPEAGHSADEHPMSTQQ